MKCSYRVTTDKIRLFLERCKLWPNFKGPAKFTWRSFRVLTLPKLTNLGRILLDYEGPVFPRCLGVRQALPLDEVIRMVAVGLWRLGCSKRRKHPSTFRVEKGSKTKTESFVTNDALCSHVAKQKLLLELLLALVVFDVFRAGTGLPDADLVIPLQKVFQLLEAFHLKRVALKDSPHIAQRSAPKE